MNFVDYEFTEMVAVENIITAVPKWVSDVKPLVFKCKLTGIRPVCESFACVISLPRSLCFGYVCPSVFVITPEVMNKSF